MTVVHERMMKNVKYYRKLCNLSQQELADKCSLTVNYISEIETGRKFPSPDTMEKLVKVFGIGYDDLFKDREEVIPSFYGLEINAEHVAKVVMRYINEEILRKYGDSREEPPEDSPPS